MGVAKLFNYVKAINESLLKDKRYMYKIEKPDDTISKVFVDFVGLIYDVLYELNSSTALEDEKLIQKIIEKLSVIFSLFPSAEYHIFFECIPTVAKIKEQYKRRINDRISREIFESLTKKLGIEKSESFSKEKFNLNPTINPFMRQLMTEIESSFHSATLHHYNENDSDNIFGEAEHRMYDYIMKKCSNETSVIVSADADLIIISTLATTRLENVTINLLRRSDDLEQGSSREFYYIEMPKYIDYLLSHNLKNKDKQKYVLDVMFIFTILGDDFVPAIREFNIKEDMIKIYESLNDINGFVLEDTKGTTVKEINVKNLSKFFNSEGILNLEKQKSKERTFGYIFLQDETKENMAKTIYTYISDNYQKCVYFKPKKRNFLHGANIEEMFKNFFYVRGNKCQLNVGNYDAISLIKNKTSSAYNPDILTNYLEGFTFVLDLYFNLNGKTKNNFWYYKYKSAPSIKHIALFLRIKNDFFSGIVKYDINVKNIEYFDYDKYISYLDMQIEHNLYLIKKNMGLKKEDHLSYDLLWNDKYKIYDCTDKSYINSCDINKEVFIDPYFFLSK